MAETLTSKERDLMRNLIDTFRSYKPFNDYNEEYKWELLDATEGKESIDFIKIVKNKQVNLYHKFAIQALNKLMNSNANELTECVNHLLDESKPLDERLADFKLGMQEACNEYDFNNFANDERTASVFLTCKYPEKYTFYKDEVYKSIWKYFGFEHYNAGKKYSHFLSIINMFSAEYGEEIQQIMLPQIDKYKNKPLNLAVQTLFWCMRDYMGNEIKENNKEMADNKYQEYIDLLKENHNLVLTGAPGTGKTYMAHAIAKEMGAETMFVQFHPSYDYTDFVDGLRPVDNGNGQIAFERKDGVFKEFCKKAIKNIEDSSKTPQELSDEITFEKKYNALIDKINNGEINEISLRTPTRKIDIDSVSNFNNIIVKAQESNSQRTYTVSFERIAKLAKQYPNAKKLNEITNINAAVNEAIRGCNASAYWAVLNEIYKQKESISSSEAQTSIDKKPFVCIIDEINRGEASKIFGELFYAIDPGYRGNTEHMVQTQYQNLVPEGDVFKNGFYVPDNVYILATMNDIDRSVESMDFAMRRRFTWKEVTPADTENMLDVLPCAKEAKECMTRLNNKIAETKGLGAAYMIGPSYFLKLKNGDFDKLWNMNLKPLLKEYLRGFRDADNILEGLEKEYFGKNDGTNEVN